MRYIGPASVDAWNFAAFFCGNSEGPRELERLIRRYLKMNAAMPNTTREQLDEVDRDIKLYKEFDEREKARFERQCFLWTAEDRIEWQKTQRSVAEYLLELQDKRNALLGELEE
ncbi:hypothetical protein SAMN05216338_1001301 [Bradyrhizobium sp. Rc2d]|uniref:hypothetical protein n=1 Tax=Bradyrhizobium sp. Rc2d TaxID=1855321 RepID=UPI00089125CB|nr:hypothetical protein [Bradyrhizobium sp. Rc2d]SDG43802.1 hypothetical protein SAMN05216338_1001301 [Bradyrhizobium sp. Rc2d]